MQLSAGEILGPRHLQTRIRWFLARPAHVGFAWPANDSLDDGLKIGPKDGISYWPWHGGLAFEPPAIFERP